MVVAFDYKVSSFDDITLNVEFPAFEITLYEFMQL